MRRFPTLLTNLISVKPSLTIQKDATEEEQTNAPTIDERKGSSVSWSGKEKSIIAGSLAIFLIIIAKNAWLSDDSYITFRTVDNFVHGYGLTWNIDERVQTYTHPLWMFLISAVYFCTHEIYYSVLLLSLTISFVALGIFAVYIAGSFPMAVAGIVMLAASKSYVDYSTSGLENSLYAESWRGFYGRAVSHSPLPGCGSLAYSRFLPTTQMDVGSRTCSRSALRIAYP